ncbi:hypothetical protein JTB14_031314 [Gonioctena quinquepunctata]|nr:hypothetical protein JTB14_031314 [Gonioctena quinquepunctata]
MISLSLFLLVYLQYIECANILGFQHHVGHQMIFQSFWGELSLRGHKVTVITPSILNDPTLTNLTEIDVGFAYKLLSGEKGLAKRVPKENSLMNNVISLFDMSAEILEAELEEEDVQKLIKSDGKHFDLIIQGQFFLPMGYGFAAKFKAPIVGISSCGVFLHTHDAVGNPTHPIISPDSMLNSEGDLSFTGKFQSFLFNIWYRIIYYWYALPRADKATRKIFGNDMPYLGDIERNISLLLLNVNPILHTVRANVPNVIEVNQMHIKEKKPLPQDLQDYLDSSPQGVVYFSLGSNVKSANLTSKLRDVILGALSDIPYNVLWKFEIDDLPGKTDNVLTRKWLPQQDVLGHPNVKVFITQGGLQSIEESIHNEVPMIGIPFITDQPTNVKKLVELGMAIGLDYRSMTRNQLKSVIIEVAENPKYKKQVEKARAILVDQPIKGVDKAIWWIEHVIRHKGAKHLRSPAADMTFIDYFLLDILAVILISSFSVLYIVWKSIQMIRSISRRHKLKKN